MNSYFTETQSILDEITYAYASPFDPSDEEERDPRWRSTYHGRRVIWAVTPQSPIILVEASKILFMEGNQWNFDHAASILQFIKDGQPSMDPDVHAPAPLRVPAGRIHRIRAADVKMTLRYEREGVLEEQMGMTRPWERSDIGSYDAQLIDGNHRASAAMLAGESLIPVYVGENYRGEIRKKDWL